LSEREPNKSKQSERGKDSEVGETSPNLVSAFAGITGINLVLKIQVCDKDRNLNDWIDLGDLNPMQLVSLKTDIVCSRYCVLIVFPNRKNFKGWVAGTPS